MTDGSSRVCCPVAGIAGLFRGDAGVCQAQSNLSVIESGVFPPAPPKSGKVKERVSRHYITGMLKAGNVRLEMHETTQAPGAPHEPIGTHLHNELWLVREGTVELMTNGVSRKMVAGDLGICIAGDERFIKNIATRRQLTLL